MRLCVLGWCAVLWEIEGDATKGSVTLCTGTITTHDSFGDSPRELDLSETGLLYGALPKDSQLGLFLPPKRTLHNAQHQQLSSNMKLLG